MFGDGKTSLRGGYGIYRDQPMGVMNNDQLSIPPFGYLASFNPPASLQNPYDGRVNPFPDSDASSAGHLFATPFSVEAYDPSFGVPTIQQWNLTIERGLRPERDDAARIRRVWFVSLVRRRAGKCGNVHSGQSSIVECTTATADARLLERRIVQNDRNGLVQRVLGVHPTHHRIVLVPDRLPLGEES